MIYRYDSTYDTWLGIKKKVYPDALMILGETASSASGGCPRLSDTFAAGFWWIHQLGQIGLYKYDMVFRQDLVGWSGTHTKSHYQLAGLPGWPTISFSSTETLLPKPDYFTSLLWKMLVGKEFLDVTPTGVHSNVSIHANCCVNGRGVVVLSYSNVGESAVTIRQDNISLPITKREEFILTSGDGTPTSSTVRLNGGDPLSSSSPLIGNIVNNDSITLPPYSYGFIRLLMTSAKACDGEAEVFVGEVLVGVGDSV
jgi:hypothetical protein